MPSFATASAARCLCRRLGIFAVTVADGSVGRCGTAVWALCHQDHVHAMCVPTLRCPFPRFGCGRCGDGRSTWEMQGSTVSGEECDDGGVLPGDGCSSSCKVEPGWSCSPPSTFQRSECQKWPPCGPRMMGEFCHLLCSAKVTCQLTRKEHSSACVAPSVCVLRADVRSATCWYLYLHTTFR